MSNPYFSNDPYFGESESARKQRQQLGVPSVTTSPGTSSGTTTPQTSPYGTYASTSTMPPMPTASDQLEQAYAMPAATTYETGRMTYDDVIMKTGLVLGTIVLAAAASWVLPAALNMPGLQSVFWIVGLIGGLVFGLVNAFKREPSPALIMAYAGFEGLFLGAISSAFDAAYSGIVLQAVLATMATFAAVLFLFKSGRVRNTPRFQRIVLVAMVGYAVFSLVNLVFLWTGIMDGWGMRSGGLGILIGVAAVVLAAAMLVIDFDNIAKGVQRGAPARYAWSAAFGLALTLVWMYLEFLRLLAILRGD